MAKFSKAPWRVVKSRRQGWAFEVRNTHRDPIAVVYTNEADARVLAASLNLLGSLKHMTAIVRLREGELRASEKAKYDAAKALINELEGDSK
jgi:hypothetical protein